MLLLPNQAGNNKITTPQEVIKFFPLRPTAARERMFSFLWGENFIITLPIRQEQYIIVQNYWAIIQ